jgi:non-specific serine/threonine protein kinase
MTKNNTTYLDSIIIDLDTLEREIPGGVELEGREYVRSGKVRLTKIEKDEVVAIVNLNRGTHTVRLMPEGGRLQLSCSCHDNESLACTHKYATILELVQRQGLRFFEPEDELRALKNKALEPYGFTVDDPLVDKLFEFRTVGNRMLVTLLDQGLVAVREKRGLEAITRSLLGRKTTASIEDAPLITGGLAAQQAQLGLGVAFDFTATRSLPGFQVKLFSAKLSESRNQLKSQFQEYIFTPVPHSLIRTPFEEKLVEVVQDISPIQLYRLLEAHRGNPGPKRKAGINADFDEYNDALAGLSLQALDGEEAQLILEHVHARLASIWDELAAFPFVFLTEGETTSRATLQPVVLKPVRYVNRLRLTLADQLAELSLTPSIPAETDDPTATAPTTPWVSLFEQGRVSGLPVVASVVRHSRLQPPGLTTAPELYLLRNSSEIPVALHMGRTYDFSLKVHMQEFETLLQEVVLPLAQHHTVELPHDLRVEQQPTELQVGIYLNEAEDRYLVLKPLFTYGSHQVVFDGNPHITFYDPDRATIIQIPRDTAGETAFYDTIVGLHPEFRHQHGREFLYLDFDKALHHGWFFDCIEKLQALQVPVYGQNKLRKFRYNTHKAKVSISFSSGIDWFDAKVNVSFGDQQVSLKALRTAILKKQNYVQLGDGSLGLLPQEWLDKYSALFRLGEPTTKGNSLRLRSIHFTIIDDLYEHIDDLEVQRQLRERRERLRSFEQIDNVPIPDNVYAELRPYQKAAFNWLLFLDSVKWGGCLADDMGLGKTLQSLTFLRHVQNQNPQAVHLIVAPRTLLFNWESEITRFTPDFTYYVHHGLNRTRNLSVFNNYNLILTTYGTLRSDIELFADYHFNYIVLDESQAIKNPASQVNKAVQTLKADNRLILTGTPIQNNTFELYAQMNFLNPGLLGNMEFFKEEYATPIDRDQDQGKIQELRRLLNPFMLRRTKEQVAPDLPDKTEMVLFCEMGSRQKQIYQAYKEEIRESLLKEIQPGQESVSHIGMAILRGLTKLRQICDSPVLLSDEGDFPAESVKLEEITRELTEHASEHKALVFSQFLGMLDLIRQRLDAAGIRYAYLDGQTTNRKEVVDAFQNEPEVRVFLISLTAGGVGLNLTAADYVYLVDPWWNPAVEQQAIDRTHRIGQDKKIFAYRMICKDTIEEKIMHLQTRKRKIADDLINDEAGFIKSLTRADLEFLFD